MLKDRGSSLVRFAHAAPIENDRGLVAGDNSTTDTPNKRNGAVEEIGDAKAIQSPAAPSKEQTTMRGRIVPSLRENNRPLPQGQDAFSPSHGRCPPFYIFQKIKREGSGR
jgi:hypothetical protein